MKIKKVRALPHVVGAAPVVIGQGLIKSAGATEFMTIKGIAPDLEPSVTNVARSMTSGNLNALTPAQGVMAGIVLGGDLAKKLGVRLGDSVEIVVPEGPLSPLGLLPGSRFFKLVGTFNLGLFEFDNSYGYIHLNVAEKFLDRSRPDFIEVKVDELFAAQQVAHGIPAQLGSEYQADDWQEMNKSLFSALWLEKMAMSITIGLIVMVAALNIIASLVLLVMEKTRDIAILKTMGSLGGEHSAHLHVPGPGDWNRRHGRWRGRRLCAHLRARPLPADSRQHRRLPDLARAVPAAPVRFRRRHGGGDSGVLRGNDLPVAAGLEAGSGAGAAVSIGRLRG